MPGPADPQQTVVTWWGHAFVALTMDGTTLLLDPLLRRNVGPLHNTGPIPDVASLGRLDGVLISHLHGDHLDLGSLRRLPRGVPIVVPEGGAEFVRRRTGHTVRGVRPGGQVDLGGVQVLATHAEHDPRRGRWRLRADPLGFVVQGSERVYFAGDTEAFDGMRTIGPLDLALMPIGGWGLTLAEGHMDPQEAATAIGMLRPRFAIPIHYGDLRIPVLWRWRAARRGRAAAGFADLVAQVDDECTVLGLAPGQPWNLPRHG
ncbi:MBL fold metallo-hydrolase [Angustibacter sp. McL0619]|uniref:MBL fold metallo-hydrolase n=1 Tax=Angustibacter sp. McL0619 TaxID=3415676 RepID=UPI003CEA351A